MKKVRVNYSGWGENWPLGVLADNGRELFFEYSPEALRKEIEFSPLKLPLTAKTYRDFPKHQMRLPGLISDSLPDGWGLLLMDKVFRSKNFNLTEVSPLDRLSFLGDRTMGAFTFEPATFDSTTREILELQEIAKEAQFIIQDRASSVLPELARLGGSPQGARPKVLVQFDSESKIVSSSDQSIGEPWLVKFQSERDHKEVCAIENFYMQLARDAGIEVEETHYFDLGETLSAFGTRRFDREKELRIPIHSVSGALNADFRTPSSVSYNSMLRLVRMITRDEREVLKAYRRCIFNIIFHNRDDHPKNFSFRLQKSGHWLLSPAYDLTFCTGPGGEHQMDISGEGKAPGLTHTLELAKNSGLDLKDTQIIIDEVIASTESFEKKAGNHPIRSETVTNIHRLVEENLRRFSHCT